MRCTSRAAEMENGSPETKNGSPENGSLENGSPENGSLENCSPDNGSPENHSLVTVRTILRPFGPLIRVSFKIYYLYSTMLG